ncbi:MAG TPA: di-trans,poly-cis-decaprenylcistransferase [Longimicrobiaceae bacterium]|nr:di-trans,poly-cis-decaprenylcistransferase [Longimicrobiaceae bacterium]
MPQSTFSALDLSRLHVALIMDGNGRWANVRGWPRAAGHRAGARTVRRIVEAAREMGIGTLTVYAFSSDNWQRPGREVSALMRLFRAYLVGETRRCVENGVRLSVIGRRDRLGPELLATIETAERVTVGGEAMHFRVAIDYSARDAILRAAARLAGEEPTRETFARALGEAVHSPDGAPEVDLLIRTGGEQRLSDFLLWECSYAELFFTPKMWPDFEPADLQAAVWDFAGRERRFGRVLRATG